MKITKANINRLKRLGWKIGYKVVDQMKSYLYFENPHHVSYAIGQTTRPHHGCGLLGVFDAKKNVYTLYYEHEHIKAFRCLYKPSKEVGFWTPSKGKIVDYTSSTRYADAVILLDVYKETKA